MILCEWDASEGHPGQSCVHLYARILSTSFTLVSIFSVCCYSIVSISVVPLPPPPIQPFVQNNLESNINMKSALDKPPVHKDIFSQIEGSRWNERGDEE
jgi:hypothetical protein